jgi:hypothetical protein
MGGAQAILGLVPKGIFGGLGPPKMRPRSAPNKNLIKGYRMAVRRGRGRRSNVRRKPTGRRRIARNWRSLRALNPQPVFTETYTKGVVVPNSGGVFTFNINEVPQLSQYNTLYQKYRILRAQLILVPQYAAGEQNAAEYNAGNNVYSHGLGRIVFAVNDSPGVLAPASELAVLQDNGCRIRPVRDMVKMSCKPVPLYEDNNGILITLKRNWINFQTGPSAPTDPKHFGISYWYSQPFLGATAQANNDLQVYCKLTFQLADPR